jgi:hypothetical protein
LILACPEGKRYPEADDVKPIAPPQPTARWTMCFNTASPVTKYIRAPSGSACLRAVCLPYLGTLFAARWAHRAVAALHRATTGARASHIMRTITCKLSHSLEVSFCGHQELTGHCAITYAHSPACGERSSMWTVLLRLTTTHAADCPFPIAAGCLVTPSTARRRRWNLGPTWHQAARQEPSCVTTCKAQK